MIGNLASALTELIETALPGLFTGQGKIGLQITGDLLEIDPYSTEVGASEPRQDDRIDRIEIGGPEAVAGPHSLSQPPYPGPRRVRLEVHSGDLVDYVPLRDDEVLWDQLDPQQFTLALRPHHALDDVRAVQVLYGVTAVFTRLRGRQRIGIELQSSNAARLEQAAGLVAAVFQLNQPALMQAAGALHEDNLYGALIEFRSLRLNQISRPSDQTRIISLLAEIELKATRAMDEREGAPIRHILTPGQPADSQRRVIIEPQVEA
jgi:hypothetical protein